MGPTTRIDPLRKAIATVVYSGYAPVAPGTAGSAVTAIGYYLFCPSLGVGAWMALLAVGFVVAVHTAGVATREWGSDPAPVVIDEAVGFLVTVAFLPHSWWITLVGFLVFRVLDVAKPPPLKLLEKLPGGWGIVLDDVGAGLYGQVVIRAGMALVAAWFGGVPE